MQATVTHDVISNCLFLSFYELFFCKLSSVMNRNRFNQETNEEKPGRIIAKCQAIMNEGL